MDDKLVFSTIKVVVIILLWFLVEKVYESNYGELHILLSLGIVVVISIIVNVLVARFKK